MRPMPWTLFIILTAVLALSNFTAPVVTQQHSRMIAPAPTATANGSVGGCASLAIDTSDTPVTPSDGTLRFGCIGGGGVGSAFGVTLTGNYTPTFTFPQYYTGLAITTANTCINYAGTGEVQPTSITSGKQVLLYANQQYFYCPSYANVPTGGGTLPSFSTTWASGGAVFSQTFASISVPARTGIFNGCSATVVDANTPASPGAGTVMLDCQGPPPSCGFSGPCPSGPQAFNASQTAYYSPTFTLPQYYTGIALTGNIGCFHPMAYGPPPAPIASGTEILLYGTGSQYYYCLSYSNVLPTGDKLSSFTISWGPGSTVFTQMVPSVTVPPTSPPPPAMGGCATTSIDSPVTAVKGVLEFDCIGGGPYSAFAVLNAGYYTPTFTLPQYYTGLSITPIADFVSNCGNPTPGYPLPMAITSGTQVYLTNHTDSGGYYYCPSYANVPMSGGTLPSFNVSWGQGTTMLAQTVPFVSVPAANDPPVSGSFSFHGVTVTVSGSLSVSLGTVSGTVSVTATNSSTGVVLFSKSYSISNLPLSNNIARFLLNVGVSPYPLSADVTVTQTGGVWSASVMLTRQLAITGARTVGIVDFSIVALDYGSSLGGPRYNPAADLTGSGTVNIIDVGIVGYYYGAAVFY